MNRKKTASRMISQMAKQSLKSSRMRNAFVMLAIALASALLTVILMFAAGQSRQTKNLLSHRQQVSYCNLTADQAALLAADSRILFLIQAKSGILSDMEGFSVMPYYVSELSDHIRVGELESGRLPEAIDEAAVPSAMLRKMGIEPAVGACITLTFYDGSTESFTVSGLLAGSETEKQFCLFLSKAYAESGSQLKDAPCEVYAKLRGADTMSADDCKNAMYLIGSDAGVERKNVRPSRAFLETLSVNPQSLMLCVLVGTVILLACVLVIYGVFYLSVIGRIHQFGQLRTLGMTRKQMKKLVLREGAALFSRSAPAGIAVGCIVGFLLIPDGFYLPDTLFIIALVLIVVYLIAMISVRKPARLAAAVSPIEALRYVPQDGMQKAAGKRLCRKLTPIALGVMNFSKNRKKAAVTMLSLALGGILFMTAATYMSSFDRDNYARQGYFKDAEFHISHTIAAIELHEFGLSGLQADAPLDQEIIREISSLEGVTRVTGIKSFGVRYDYPKNDLYGDNDMVRPLTREETETIGGYIEEGSADYDKLMSGGYLLVADNDTAEEVYGWRFAVGDVIMLHYYDGQQMSERKVEILGILDRQYTLDQNIGMDGWFLMPEAPISDWLSYDSLNTDLIVSTQPDREAKIGEALAQIVAKKPELTLETLAERKVAYARSANQIFAAISGLAVFIMMFSMLSMMNTLITNVVTRKQELAMLTSIGMSRAQTQNMLMGESLLLVLATVGVTMTAGSLCGLALNHALYHAGAFYMTYRFPAALAIAYTAVLLVVPFTIIAVSMRSFSKEPLVERLRGAEN